MGGRRVTERRRFRPRTSGDGLPGNGAKSPRGREGVGGYDRPTMSAPTATPIAYTEAELDAVKFDAAGLAPAIVQEESTGQVLMLAWMNREALQRTLETGRTWFWSRSRQEYWCKGETSGDRQFVRRAAYDCDMDCLLLVVEQEGRGACHTGERSCFFRDFGGGSEPGPR